MVTYGLLGSYLAQSLLGDYDPAEHGTSCDYLCHIQFAPSTCQSSELLANIAELHRSRRGQSASSAELEYLINTSRLAMYGVDVHPVLVIILIILVLLLIIVTSVILHTYIHTRTLNFKCIVQEHFSHFTDLGRRVKINEFSALVNQIVKSSVTLWESVDFYWQNLLRLFKILIICVSDCNAKLHKISQLRSVSEEFAFSTFDTVDR